MCTLREKIFLVGDVDSQIVGNKLPSGKQVLKVFFFNVHQLNFNIRESAILVAKEVSVFWDKAGIPVKAIYKCSDKIQELYQQWRSIQKCSTRESNKIKEQKFAENIENLFDIAAPPDMIKDIGEEKLLFLQNQRKPGRVGYIGEIKTLLDYELSEEEINDILEKRKARQLIREQAKFDDVIQLEDSNPSNSQISSLGSNFSTDHLSKRQAEDTELSFVKKSRGSMNIINDKVVATFDKCHVTGRNAVRLITCIAEALGQDLNNIIINRTSIDRYRKIVREELALKIKELFESQELNAAQLHWDGKLLNDYSTDKKVDRLAIIISNLKTEKILAIPALENGSGSSQATAMSEVIHDWGLVDTIQILCCDTTNSNLGASKGAATLLERQIDRKLLYLPCRHHIFEIVLAGVFDTLMPATSTGPSIVLFNKFKNEWQQISKQNFKTGLEDKTVAAILANHAEEIALFSESVLNSQKQPRDDYREFLLLSLIFIGKISRENVTFYKPGSVSKARWMAKAIYCLKIFLFREVFCLTASEENAIRDICIFILIVYLRAWFEAPFAHLAPKNDLDFVKTLHNYRHINVKVSQVALKKFANHLWYLSPEAVAISFFDERLSDEVKKKMVSNIKDQELPEDIKAEIPKRYIVSRQNNIENLFDKDVNFFITPDTLSFFERFKINSSFLDEDPSKWRSHHGYQFGKHLVENLTVVNDVAERGIKLITEYNQKLTDNEEQKQYIIQILDKYSKAYPDVRKDSLLQPMQLG